MLMMSSTAVHVHEQCPVSNYKLPPTHKHSFSSLYPEENHVIIKPLKLPHSLPLPLDITLSLPLFEREREREREKERGEKWFD